jgi:putative oxidoreductase
MAVNAAVSHSAPSQSRSSALHISLWVAQVLLFAVFMFTGLMKLLTPIPQMAQSAPWVADLPALVRFIGLSEVAGALGLILPSVTRVKPQLTALAALGLATIMVLAAGFHLMRGEYVSILTVVVLGAIAMFVAWGRSRAAKIAPR